MDANIIVNHMLTTIGEGGVSTLMTTHPSVVECKQTLDTENNAFQSEGWWFNTERKLKLVQDDAGRVELPAECLSMQIHCIGNQLSTEKLRYVKRGKFVYDTYLHTNVLNRDLYVDIVMLLDIADLPYTAANYLMHKCAEVQYLSDDGDEQKTNRLVSYTTQAWAKLKSEELRVTGANALDGTTAQALNAYGGYTGFRPYGGGTR
jgi:hypothetical protein